MVLAVAYLGLVQVLGSREMLPPPPEERSGDDAPEKKPRIRIERNLDDLVAAP